MFYKFLYLSATVFEFWILDHLYQAKQFHKKLMSSIDICDKLQGVITTSFYLQGFLVEKFNQNLRWY
jgi:hypothetical protein